MGIKAFNNRFKRLFSFVTRPIKSYFSYDYIKRNSRYAKYYKYLSIKKNVILYESFYGRGLLCGPYALFSELIKHPVYGKYKHVWVLDDMDNHRDLIKKYKRKYSNVSFVEFGSKKYIKYLTSAGYLINNVTFYGYFIKKEGQVYINTWHGIPLKHLGYDMPGGGLDASNMARNFMHADYLISANPFLTDIYKNAFRQEGISKTKIIEEGYPRLDTLVNTDRNEIYEELREKGVSVDSNKKIILYAPTWRGDSYANPDCSMDDFINLKETLEKMIDTDKYQILVKVHQVVYSIIKEKLDEFNYVVPATMDANVILGITDILISDFSSIYFDYLATGRPVLFYITDLEEYSEKRGMYFGVDELPGPNTDNLEVLGKWINDIDTVFAENKERYDKIRDWCCDYDIGKISQKIVQTVFDKNTDGVRIIGCENQKKKVLISKGPMLVNGISTALINLLNQFDYDKYDVTVFVDSPKGGAQREQIKRINPKARVLVRPGMMDRTTIEGIRNNFYTKCNPKKGITNIIFPKKIYEREFRRLYGESKFDYIIDYEGYSVLFATICLMQEDAKKYIWLHNDMISEYEERFNWLEKIFALYPKFDYLVSCSKQIMEVNREKLSDIVSADKFRYAKNCVDFGRVNAGRKIGKILFDGNNYYYTVSGKAGSNLNMRLIPLQPGVPDELDDGSVEIISSGKKVDNGITRFVNLGRLSVEKNQVALVKAFAKLAEEVSDVMLYLVGDGPLKKELKILIRKLGLQDKVIITGNLSNPFGLMKQCDCFVLPSLHEGQPLVVFEARALHLPIILSDFSSVGGSKIENGQYIVHKKPASIYKGLKAFVSGKVPSDYDFHDEQYNREAYAEFEAAVFGDGNE